MAQMQEKSVLTDEKTLDLERKAEEAEKEALAVINKALAERDSVIKSRSSESPQGQSCKATMRNTKEAQRAVDGWHRTSSCGIGYSGASGVRGIGYSGVSGTCGLGNSGVSGVRGLGYSGVSGIVNVSGMSDVSGVSGIAGSAPPPFVSGTHGFEWPAAVRVREDLRHEWDERTRRCRYCNVARSSVECGFNPLHLPDRVGGGWNCHHRYLQHLSPFLRQIAEQEMERLRIYGPDWIVEHEPAELERQVRLRNISVLPL